ncbi:alpha-ketoglutarate permease [Duganella sp. Leaf126]|uniref:MFS family transporter n=1 Tax=Duganella sp. Leaf126 TaxID=1736266 RepID=UPI0006F85995|nr:MFS family transporter [Duganella sp. Leaf126]KQQ32503.1 alpha-ketoglutarate permease [Duganella sp. Leaf126]
MTATAQPPHPHYTPEEKRKRIFAIISASSGNLVEWFDFYVYSFASIYFASQFFPSGHPTTEFLKSAAVFAVGFLMRPIGGWLFGRIADRVGRKKSMMISVMMMCGGSLAIAVLPTYASIGVAAPILLLIVRMFQGLSVGGEYGTTATYMSEVALRGRRGFFSSFQYVTLIGGQLLAVLTVVVLEVFLTEAELKAWGWRIPFVLGAIAAVVSLLLRRTLHETSKAADLKNEGAGTLAYIFKHHRAAFLTVIGYTAGGSLIFYTFTTYMQKYLVNSAGMPAKTASVVMTGALFLYMCMQPLFGMLADRIGRRHSMMLFGALGAIATYPILAMLRGNDSPVLAFVLITVALAIVSLYTSISGLVKAEMFPPEVRALGVGFSYAIANAIFGGSAEFVGLAFKNLGHENWFFVYVTLMMVIAFLVSTRLPKSPSYLHTDH